MAAAGRAAFREHAAAVLLCSTGSSQLVAESPSYRSAAGRLRTWLTRRILGSRAPLGPVTPLARRILKYGTMGAGSAPRHGRGVRPDRARLPAQGAARLVAGARPARSRPRRTGVAACRRPSSSARRTGSPRRRRRARWPPRCRDCVGLTELPGIGHMTPVEAPRAGHRPQIRELRRRTYVQVVSRGGGA